MKHLVTAASALALLGGAAYAQTNAVNPMPPPAADKAAPAPDKATSGAAAVGATTAPAAASATAPGASSNASAVVSVASVTNGPIADTPENRAKYGQPLSRAGRMTKAKGN